MKICITDFGPISNFTLDVSTKLTAIYGNNNIGKSYALQIVYLVIKNLKQIYHRYGDPDFIDDEFDFYLTMLDSDAKKTIDASVQNELSGLIKSEVERLLSRRFLVPLLRSFETTFKSYRKSVRNTTSIKLCMDDVVMVIDIFAPRMSLSYTRKVVYAKNSDYFSKRSTATRDTLYYSSNKMEQLYNGIEQLISQDIRLILKQLVGMTNAVYFLPASRSGIYTGLSAFSGIVAELAKSKSVLYKKLELPGLSEAISDYFITLTDIASRGYPSIETGDDKVSSYSNAIENYILQGDVVFDKKSSNLLYHPFGKDITLSMDEVSSMVSELAPIVAYLRMIRFNYLRNLSRPQYLKKYTYVFIEEPEAHLHPTNQIKLMDLFAQFASMNIILFMTSHSNYVFNKFNNLILDGKLSRDTYEPILMKHVAEGSIGEVIEVDELGALDTNFMEPTEALFNEREEIIEKKFTTDTDQIK